MGFDWLKSNHLQALSPPFWGVLAILSPVLHPWMHGRAGGDEVGGVGRVRGAVSRIGTPDSGKQSSFGAQEKISF